MISLDYQMIRQAVREEFADLLGAPDEEVEEELTGDCQACQAALLDLRAQIAELKVRIADLENRPYVMINEPVRFNTNPIYKIELIPNTTGQPPTYSNLSTVTCKQ